MLLIPCPHCGPRPEGEFHYGGEAHIARPHDPATLDDAGWGAFLYMRTNPRGVHAERWRHLHGCGRFFNLRRDTRNDRFLEEPSPNTLPKGEGYSGPLQTPSPSGRELG